MKTLFTFSAVLSYNYGPQKTKYAWVMVKIPRVRQLQGKINNTFDNLEGKPSFELLDNLGCSLHSATTRENNPNTHDNSEGK